MKRKPSKAIRGPAAADDPYRQLFEAAAIGINWREPDRRLIEANAQFCTLVGYDHDVLLSCD